MYLGVDVGGTKTLVAVLDNHGAIKEKTVFPTSQNYDNFLLELRHTLAHFEHQEFKAGGVGVAGRIDRKHGRRFPSGKLSWDGVPIQSDVQRIADCPIVVENDAKMAGLSEAMMVKDEFRRVLYLTVSTGIGFALVVDGIIDTSIGDRGGTNIMLEHRGKHISWENLISGRAIVRRFGKKARDINDRPTWQTIARDLSRGLIEVVAVTEPEVVIIGGSVGSYFDRYGKLLAKELAGYDLPAVMLPKLREAQRPEEAVVYGCYDLAKQVYAHANVD